MARLFMVVGIWVWRLPPAEPPLFIRLLFCIGFCSSWEGGRPRPPAGCRHSRSHRCFANSATGRPAQALPAKHAHDAMERLRAGEDAHPPRKKNNDETTRCTVRVARWIFNPTGVAAVVGISGPAHVDCAMQGYGQQSAPSKGEGRARGNFDHSNRRSYFCESPSSLG